jgi:predicted nucleotidyltransferase
MKGQSQLDEVCRRLGVANLYVFGSRAEEIATTLRGGTPAQELPGSDVDVGVTPLPGSLAAARERVQLVIELEDLLAAPRVDLVVVPEADPFLAVEVIRGELLYCVDATAQAEEELYVLRRAGDLAPLKRERLALILGEGAAP